MLRKVREPGRWPEDGAVPSHAGLAYSRWAPPPVMLKEGAEQGAEERNLWLDRVARCREPKDYAKAYWRWEASLSGPDTVCFKVEALERVLVGHGNPSPVEVGLTLHHTWGVPVLPGSALKGLTAGYVEAVYGPDPGREERERELFRGVEWEGSRMVRGPGTVYRRLFGAPDVTGPGGHEGASQGEVVFHDALWVPAQGKPMLARDVLTVHQRGYYASGGETWPGDFDDPNPVAFLTVAPGACFLVALSVAPEVRGGRELLARAARYLKEALGDWGVGGKTAAGYGRFKSAGLPEHSPRQRAPEVEHAPRMERRQKPGFAELEAWLGEQAARKVVQRTQFQQLEAEWQERLLALDMDARRAAAQVLAKHFNLKKGDEKPRLDALLARLQGLSEPPG